MVSTDDVKKILGAIKVAFPNYKLDDPQLAVDMYKAMFKDYTYEQISKGLQRYILTNKSGFAPTIGQLIDCMLDNETTNQINEQEAWAMVSRAVRNGLYGAEKEFNALPEIVQKALGSPSRLSDMARDENYNEAVEMSQFLRTYRNVCDREREDRKLPPELKQLATNTVKEITDNGITDNNR